MVVSKGGRTHCLKGHPYIRLNSRGSGCCRECSDAAHERSLKTPDGLRWKTTGNAYRGQRLLERVDEERPLAEVVNADEVITSLARSEGASPLPRRRHIYHNCPMCKQTFKARQGGRNLFCKPCGYYATQLKQSQRTKDRREGRQAS